MAPDQVLFGDTFVDPAQSLAGSCDFRPKADFKSFNFLLMRLFEMMLDGDGKFECFRSSSHPYMSTIYSYLFILITAIVLVNVLVAIITKTYDTVQENLAKQFLFIKTRTIYRWLFYPAVPPPFNFLSLPFYLALCCLQQYFSRFGPHGRASRIAHRVSLSLSSPQSLSFWQQEAKLPATWHKSLGSEPLDFLTAKILEFKCANANEAVQMEVFQETVTSELAHVRQELLAIREGEARRARDMEELKRLCRRIVNVGESATSSDLDSCAPEVLSVARTTRL